MDDVRLRNEVLDAQLRMLIVWREQVDQMVRLVTALKVPTQEITKDVG